LLARQADPPLRTAGFFMRVDLNVPYAERHRVKKLGARWDLASKVWYVENIDRLEPFARWIPKHILQSHRTKTRTLQPDRTYLHVPAGLAWLATKRGAAFDDDAGLFYIPDGADEKELRRWLPKTPKSRATPELNAAAARHLRSI